MLQVEILNNAAFQCAGICMLDNCTMLNENSLYSGNVVTQVDAAAVYGKRWCDITNVETTFEGNTGIGGIVLVHDYGSLINNASTSR